MCIVHVKCQSFLSDYKTCIFSRFSKNTQSVKFHENPFSGRRVVPCGRIEDMKLIKLLFAILRTRLKMVRKYTPIPGSYGTRSNQKKPVTQRLR
jgi:hypothetical protein